jgi:hypothetical protein
MKLITSSAVAYQTRSYKSETASISIPPLGKISFDGELRVHINNCQGIAHSLGLLASNLKGIHFVTAFDMQETYWECTPVVELENIALFGFISQFLRLNETALVLHSANDEKKYLLMYNKPHSMGLHVYRPPGSKQVIKRNHLVNYNWIPPEINCWYSNKLPKEVATFISTGKIGLHSEISPFLFGLFDLKNARPRSPPKTRRETRLKQNIIAKRDVTSGTLFVVEKFESLHDLFCEFKQLYQKTLFEKVIIY